MALCALDQLEVGSSENKNMHIFKKCLHLAARVSILAIMALNAYVSFHALSIGISMLGKVLCYHGLSLLGGLVLPAILWPIFLLNILATIYFVISVPKTKIAYNALNHSANTGTNLGLKEWIYFSFQSLNPFFQQKVAQGIAFQYDVLERQPSV